MGHRTLFKYYLRAAMDKSDVLPVIQSALGSMTGRPLNLAKSLRSAGDLNGIEVSEGLLSTMLSMLIDSDPNALARLRFEQLVHGWDNAAKVSWGADTPPNSNERRSRIYDCLTIDADFAKKITDTI